LAYNYLAAPTVEKTDPQRFVAIVQISEAPVVAGGPVLPALLLGLWRSHNIPSQEITAGAVNSYPP